MKPVIGESAGIEDVHHLMLLTLLHELAWEKGKQGCDDGLDICLRTVTSCMKTGGCPGVCGRGLSRGLQGGRPDSGRVTNTWSSTWGTEGGCTKWCGRVGDDSEAVDRCTGTRYNSSMIQSFRHRGLRRLYERGDPSRIGADQLDRITLTLADLDVTSKLSELDLPGYRLHPLRGDRKGSWSISISGNWRITFRFEDGDVYDVDLVDYH